jgi:GTP 3',8-cyclase
MKEKDWHLRVSLTDDCNFRCLYCNPDGLKSNRPPMSGEEIQSILKAAKTNGIKRVHWTGGEPTIFRDGETNLVTLVQHATDLGYVDQVITTNGSLLYQTADSLAKAGLNRINVSIDSIEPERNRELTGRNMLDRTMRSLEAAVTTFSEVTKMNVVAMKDTLPELPKMVAYAAELTAHPEAKGKVGLKLLEICPNNPAQLQESGEKFYIDQHVGRTELMDVIGQIGKLTLLGKEDVNGDNPNARYYMIGDTGVAVGFVTMPSTNWPCGKDYCRKFRITPYGGAAICLNNPIVDLMGKSDSELSETIQAMMQRRETLKTAGQKHYRPMLGEMRFGDSGGTLEPKPAEYFIEACTRNR